MRQTKNKSSEKFPGFIRLLRLGGDEDSEEEEDEKNEKKSKTVEKLSDGKQQQKAGSSNKFQERQPANFLKLVAQLNTDWRCFVREANHLQ